MTRLFEAKPWIVAECGSNWETLSHCLQSIALAKNCGADAVKFQAFSVEALYGYRLEVREGVIESEPHRLPLEWLPKLREKADACGIELMVTAFSPELVEAVDPFVSVHKVASSDLSYPQLLEAVAKTGKPILLSTGASSRGDIQLAVNTLHQTAGLMHESFILMYCVSAYPARTVNLEMLNVLFDAFPTCLVGFSDHTTDILGAPLAAARNIHCQVVEKHFTAFPELCTPDRPHSLTSDEFKIMVDHIRGHRKPVIGPTPEERDMILRHNRRLIATKYIREGDVLRYGVNYGAYRSLKDDDRGLSPFAWTHVEGKQATVCINRGEGIGPQDFAH